MPGPLRPLRVDQITVDDIEDVLKPIWTAKRETASRLRGRIEKVLDAAIAKGHRKDLNPARWRKTSTASCRRKSRCAAIMPLWTSGQYRRSWGCCRSLLPELSLPQTPPAVPGAPLIWLKG
ncbi:phage integrase central domain-containing protein [Kaistia soli]|uniref:phage integrase central domain-containing protein n=1 Tax=Kaistia soli TaxID=446684 RepID=UPI003CC80755